MEIISGGVTAPIGFLAAGMHAGVRKNKKKKQRALQPNGGKALNNKRGSIGCASFSSVRVYSCPSGRQCD